jgi:hypothetical protein
MGDNGTLAHTSSGYDYDRATLTKLLAMFRLPERSATESALVADFLSAHISEYSDFNFTVPIGQGRPANPAHDPGVQASTVRSSRMKIDMIAWQGDQATIFEVKQRATHYALGQAITYRHVWMLDNPNANEPRLAIIARSIEPDMVSVFDAQGVTVYLYATDTAPGAATGGGVPPGDGQAA